MKSVKRILMYVLLFWKHHLFNFRLPTTIPIELPLKLPPESKSTQSFVDRELSRLLHHIPANQFGSINFNQGPQVYNDNPPGRGFVMR